MDEEKIFEDCHADPWAVPDTTEMFYHRLRLYYDFFEEYGKEKGGDFTAAAWQKPKSRK